MAAALSAASIAVGAGFTAPAWRTITSSVIPSGMLMAVMARAHSPPCDS